MDKRSIIFYLDEIYKIGGIETWLYNLTEVLKSHFDILVLYGHADENQLKRLNVPSEKYIIGKRYYCDILLNMINGRPNSIRAGHIIQVIHANYAQLPPYTKYSHWNRVDTFIFVSEAARDNFMYPLLPSNHVVIPNPIARQTIPKRKPKKDNVFRFMSATRLTEEKGGGRIAYFIKKMDEYGLDFRFDIWTNLTKDDFCKKYNICEEGSHLFMHEPKLNLKHEMVNSDYICQFSDCESFCYTIYEALSLHVPVLVTDWYGVKNVVRNGLNGYIFDMNMTNISIDKIKKIPNSFGILPNSNRQWIQYLQNVPIYHQYEKPFNYFLT